MRNPSLAEIQSLFWKLITAPEGVARGLDDLEPPEREIAEGLVRSRPPLSAVERWDIYANMYFYRLRDCLQQDFTAVAAIVGEVSFHNLITDYLLAHPPSHFSLRYAGQHLATFLRTHELSQRRPYLADLAELEYAIVDSFDAADAEPLTVEELRRVPAEDWPHLRLNPVPSLRLLRLDWAVAEVWRAAKGGDEAVESIEGRTRMRVWRRGWRVFHKVIDEREAAALAALMDGASFEEMCAALDGEEGTRAAVALELLNEWLAEEVLKLRS